MGTCYSHLSPDERIRIERLHCEQGLSVRETARLVGRDKATVSRELKRGLWFASNENGSYRPYRPRRLKTGPWTSMPFYSALAAQRRADLRRHESRCISMLLYIVKGFGVLVWLVRGGDGLDPEGGATFEFG